jgi:hypothetical protein
MRDNKTNIPIYCLKPKSRFEENLNVKIIERKCLLITNEDFLFASSLIDFCNGCTLIKECQELNNEMKCDSCRNKICDPDDFWFNCSMGHWEIAPENTKEWKGNNDPWVNCPDYEVKNEV